MENELNKTYNPSEVEDELYEFWLENDFFKAKIDKSKKPFTIVMPPPNITGKLHMGHALDETLQDTIIRFKRMQGFSALWIPGTDHASIATEAKIVQKMREEGISKEEIGREEFLKRAWQWKKEYGRNIVNQIKKLGASCDWSRERFTMDEGCTKAVRKFFVKLYEEGLIYKGERMINWCPKCKTSISDSEVTFEEKDGNFYHLKYQVANEKDKFITVATTRPETLFGDTAVAVNPNDDRYKNFIGKKVIVPIINREVLVIADDYVDMEMGTGALKITPAHDPNDFEVGNRHNLAIINVMNDDATMNEKAGKYCGLDRFEARKKVIEELRELDLLGEIKELKHNVGTCYRCSNIVEPKISKQWFVKMESLAKPAIECVKNSDVKFIPERFSKIYFHWMENIKDWCISRQLWWGHRIPVWYCKDCGEVMASCDDVAKCESCGSENVYQDEDTLDTWFSSGLWPFSTLGWPEKTPELDYFYPTNVLVTGYDIIFFWVAKMIFSSMKIMEKPPFENILIHGLVRDSLGRKMSKSLGNGIDPLEIIKEYGADALRFSLLLGISPGNDIRFFNEKVEASRNFANKIWNAARFVHMNIDKEKIKPNLSSNLNFIDKWILSRFNKVAKEVTENMEKFELGIAAQKIYDFIWDEFCDWYIEFSKISGKKEVLLWVMINSLKLLHPFMPFVTEKIWLSFVNSEKSIMISEYPISSESLIDENSEKSVTILMSVIKSIRNLRKEMNVPYGKKTTIYIQTEDRMLIDIFEKSRDIICKLAYAKNIEIANNFELSKSVSAVNDFVKIYIPVDELVDVKAEISRLNKELEVTEKQFSQAMARLNNENFVSKAPQKVIEGARESAEKLKNKISKLKESIEELSK